MDRSIIYCESGGCTAKLGAGLLHHILEKLPKGTKDENLLIGFDSKDDGAVYQISGEQAIIQTLDFFPPMVEDPYLFGQIAAANAMSDVFAMGGEVKTALNIVCFPESGDLNILGEILRGGCEKVIEAGGVLAGGHSIADDGIKYGLSVMGTVHPDRIYPNDACRPGDVLVFTKKLGTGIICAANRVGEADKADFAEAVDSMCTLNSKAAEISTQYDVHSCTDVTGFGFLGHLHEMMNGKISARIESKNIPVLSGALAYANEFLLTGGGQKNRNYAGKYVSFHGIAFEMEELLFDPQTSGGLLFSLEEQDGIRMCEEMRCQGLPASVVGTVTERDEQEIYVY